MSITRSEAVAKLQEVGLDADTAAAVAAELVPLTERQRSTDNAATFAQWALPAFSTQSDFDPQGDTE
jgi:hypothetical protein